MTTPIVVASCIVLASLYLLV